MIIAKETPALRAIQKTISSPIEEMGYELVRLSFNSSDRPALQIMVDRKDGEQINVDDCADISRTVSVLLDVEDPIEGRYNLEVSSPGIDRPLTRPKDFKDYEGFDAKVVLKEVVQIEGLESRKKFSGVLGGLSDDSARVILNVDGQEIEIAFEAIEKAKLVLTDELIAAHQQS